MAVYQGSKTLVSRPREPMEDGDVETLVGNMIDQARSYQEEYIEPDRAKATKYYHRERFGNEEEGRSQVVTSDVLDAVDAIMPAVMDVLSGPERFVEFKPRSQEDEELAKQQTDVVNYYILDRNDGYLQCYAAVQDALIRRLGWLKVYVEEGSSVDVRTMRGISSAGLEALYTDEEVGPDDVEILETRTVTGPGIEYEEFDIRVTRTVDPRRSVHFCAVPGEEISWNDGARSIDDARIIVHTRELLVGDLVSMGYDADEIEDHLGRSMELFYSTEREARERDAFSGGPVFEGASDFASQPVRYDEAYVRLDTEGDGTLQLYKVCTIGPGHALLDYEPVARIPFAALCAFPEAHTIQGSSAADRVMDLQEIASAIWRGTLDSLGKSIDPDMEVVASEVEIPDLLNPELSKYIRVNRTGMIREIPTRFVGGETLPIVETLRGYREERLGQSRAAQGLNADALQSSTKAAVAATVSASHQRLKHIVRNLAETGFKRIMRIMAETLAENQHWAETVRLRGGEYVEVDPRSWNLSMDLITNVGLGQGTTDERMASLAAILERQDAVMGTMGPDNPLTDLRRYAFGVRKLAEISGWHPDHFWKYPTEEDVQRMAGVAAQSGQQQQQQPADPALMAAAQAELQKVEIAKQKAAEEIALKRQELALKQQELALKQAADAMEDDRLRDRDAAEFAIKKYELELKYQQSIDDAELRAKVDVARAEITADANLKTAAIYANEQNEEDGANG